MPVPLSWWCIGHRMPLARAAVQARRPGALLTPEKPQGGARDWEQRAMAPALVGVRPHGTPFSAAPA